MNLTVLIDTNVMMVALSPKSNLHWIYKAIINGDFQLVVNNEILLEYEEQICLRYDKSVVNDFLLILFEASNVIHHEAYYKWQLIQQDPDDNKFVDCCISAEADYIVSHDKHFDVLRQIDFPLVNVVNALEFKEIYEKRRR